MGVGTPQPALWAPTVEAGDALPVPANKEETPSPTSQPRGTEGADRWLPLTAGSVLMVTTTSYCHHLNLQDKLPSPSHVSFCCTQLLEVRADQPFPQSPSYL